MKRIGFVTKKTFFWLAPVLLLASTFSILMPQKAFAADEIYQWTSNTSVSVTGGDLQSPGSFTTQAPNGNMLFATLAHKSGCNLRLQMLIGPGRGTLSSPSSIGGAPIANACSPDIVNTYVNTQVTIQGTRPAPGDAQETQLQKHVSIILDSPKKNAESPTVVAFTIKNASGQTVNQITANREVLGNEQDINTRAVRYTGGFDLEGSAVPGTPYSVCFSALLDTCQNFNKIKFQQLTLSYGEISSSRSVGVQIKSSLQIPAGAGFRMGPIDVTLENADGTGKKTLATNIYNYPKCPNDVPNTAPPPSECAAVGLATVSINPIVSAAFEDLNPGAYKVCVPILNQCKDAPKSLGQNTVIEFTLTANQAQDIASGVLGGDEESPRCETNGNPLTWMLCPILNGMTQFADWIVDDVLQPLLKSEPVDLDPNSSIYKIWSAFRVYGNIVLLIALIVTVFGQVIGGGVIEAYTARKMLPRILLSAVLINLSIYIVALAVDISNIVGFAIADLIIAPVKESAQFTFTPNGIDIASAGAVGGGLIGLFVAGFFAGSLLGPAAIFILLFVVLPAVLSLLATFITIILLHGLIFALIVMSPVAFALYCLPNTEQYFKTWWDWLFRALLVYPIIMIIFAIADVMSVAILQANR